MNMPIEQPLVGTRISAVVAGGTVGQQVNDGNATLLSFGLVTDTPAGCTVVARGVDAYFTKFAAPGDLAPAADQKGTPVVIPGSHRLAWLALSGNPPIAPIYTVTVATNEVLP